MKVDIPYKFGQSIFLKNDIEQIEYLLSRIILESKGRIVLELMTPIGEYIEVSEMMVRVDKDILKTLNAEKKEEEPDE